MSKTLVLVDGSYYLFRAYHVQQLQRFRTANDEPTGAIFGVMNMLHKLLKDYDPEHFAVVFDARGKSFRNDLYEEYKANRAPIPEDLECQFEPLHEIIRAEGFPMLMIDGVEADDVIATLAARAVEKGFDVVISTGDKDLAQIVNDHIILINTMTDTVLDPAGVEEKFGVPPERIVDYLALVGDSVDNIPGVPKVGPKTAARWLKQYGSLDGVIEHADEIKGKVGDYLRDSLDRLPLSRELVTLKSDLELALKPENLIRDEPDVETLLDHFRRWEFNSWIKQLPINAEDDNDNAGDDNSGKPGDYEIIFTAEGLDRWIKVLEKASLFAFDTETTSLNYMIAEIVGVSFSTISGSAAYVPLAHDYDGAPKQLDRNDVLKRLSSVLSSDKRKKLGHNLKYDQSVLANYGIELNGIEHDSMLESYVLNSTASRHDMDSLAQKYLNIRTTHYEEVAGKGAKQVPFNKVPVEIAGPYAAEDADITLRLHETLWPRLSEEKNLKEIYQHMEVPLLSILSRMERNGVMIDVEMLHEQSRELTGRMAEIEEHAHNITGETFNIGSPKQIQAILYEKMELPVISKTPKGQPSTAEAVLQDLADQGYELPRLILDHRAMSKLKSTYTDRLPGMINASTGRVHTSYHQAVAATGRLSSSDPNLQNIPIRSPEGRKIRRAFIAPPGYALLAADYSQIELRIMAHLSGDKSLLKAFEQGEDIHRATASEVFDTELDEVTSEQRRSAKAINFGLIYGMSAWGLARQLGIDRGAAKEYVDRYFERYPGVKQYMDDTRERARELGYVETVFGRRLYLPEINARNVQRRQYAERTAINAPMQGTAADIIKKAMLGIDREILGSGKDIKMIMQVHDELIFEAPEDTVEEMTERIAGLMAGAAELSVPLEVETGIGANWDEAH
ncbi:MAG: DNA polymerase I [Gammaproteobacteria bacterium]